MPVNIRKAGNVVNIDLGVNDVNSYELAAVANSFSFNSTTSVVKSRFFKNWGLEVPLNQLIIDGVVPANEAAFNAALATLSTVTTSGGGGGTPGGAVNSIQYNNAGAFGGIGFGNAGEVLTSNGNGIAASFQPAAGGAPILPSTEIAFGNGVDPYTSSGDFVYDVGSAFFNVTFSAGNNTGIFIFDASSEITYTANVGHLFSDFAGNVIASFMTNASPPIVDLGDVTAGFNQTKLTLSDATQTLTYQKGSDVWFSTDISNATGFWGEPGNANGTSIAWDDANQTIGMGDLNGVASHLYMFIDGANSRIKIGNSGIGGSQILLDDAAPSLVYKAATNQYLFLDIANGMYSIGDLSSSLNSTKGVFDDATKLISMTGDNFILDNAGHTAFYSCNGSNGASDDVVISGTTLHFIGGLYVGAT